MKKTALGLLIFGCLVGATFAESNRNVGLGIILGEPTGLTFKLWNKEAMAFDAAAAWSFVGGTYFQIHGDMLFHNFNLFRVETGRMSLYYGAGARIKFAEDGAGGRDTTVSLRVPFGLAYEFDKTPVEIFMEIVPMLDLIPSTHFQMAGAVGFRYYF
ncbi:MAG TPA: DUF3996 domain-containing protein [Candidatus Aminicenantes bacterium]|nr:DUF3996 domain-containing protein [Candidatus Aminicenantes bacterium]